MFLQLNISMDFKLGVGGDSHKKRTGVLDVPFRGFGTSLGVQPQKVPPPPPREIFVAH